MMRVLVFVFGIMFLSGCIVRTYTIQKPRQDISIKGNRGYLLGTPKEPPKEPKKTRTLRVIDIELGEPLPEELEIPSQEKEPLPEELKSTSSEKGVLEKEIYQEEANQEVSPEEKVSEEKVTPQQLGSPQYTTYTIQKNDTLQKISKKFYGTTKKWKKIYQENKDVIKDPDKIYPGLVIKIPSLH